VSRNAAALVCVTLAVGAGGANAAAPRPDLAGVWTLNGGMSDAPRDVGFDPDWQDKETPAGGRSSGGGGGRSGGGGGGRGGRGGGSRSSGSGAVGSLKPRFESEEDSKKIKQLVTEVENPPATLTITQTDADVTIADARGISRMYHTNGKEQTIQLEAGPIGVVTRWEAAQLVIRYLVEKDRELRFTLSRAAGARQLLVTSQFAERGRGEIITRIYDLAVIRP
jgi:hypothetical protein